ncbi:MAG: ATP-binding protein [Verrucomicrobia bacterium]|nr:ATP-binding protein [Verrucomicrobiota bacterium]
MIIEFTVQNYRSFKKEQTLNLAASNYDKSLPENVMVVDLPGLQELRLVKAAALYGPNAGGKTNVLRALAFLQWLVVNSATGLRPGAKLPSESFRLDPETESEPTILTLTFVAENIRYELAVAVSPDRIVQERLVAWPAGRAQVWYDRVWDAEAKSYGWSPAQPTDFKRDPGIVEKTRENALFLSTAALWNNAQVASVYRWFERQLRFLNLAAGGGVDHAFTAKLMEQSPETRIALQRLLRMADLGVAGVDAKERDIPEDNFRKAFTSIEKELGQEILPRKTWEISFQHEGKEGKVVSLPWPLESAGTCRFFSLLGPGADVVANRYVICIDELDTSLHPLLVAELLRLFFKSTEENPGAQLLVTTHNPLLLDITLLRRDQVWFADKDHEGASFLYPLTDYKPRVDESLARGYLSGRYGAVPFIPKGLVAENPAALEQPCGKPEVAHAR